MEDSKIIPPPSQLSPQPEGKEVCADKEHVDAHAACEMSMEKAKGLIHKTSVLHEELFRRLAE